MIEANASLPKDESWTTFSRHAQLQHYDPAMKAMKAGIAVLREPLCLNLKEAGIW